MIIYCKPSTLLVLYVIREIYHLNHIIGDALSIKNVDLGLIHLYFGTLGPIGIPNCKFSKVTVISVSVSLTITVRVSFLLSYLFLGKRDFNDFYMGKTELKLSLLTILKILSSILFPAICRPSETCFLWSPLRKQS